MLPERRLPIPQLSALLTPCLRGMRKNLVPGLVLQLVALTLLALYAISPAVGTFLNAVGAYKREYGFLFSACSTAMFGGVIPFLVMLLTGRLDRALRWHIFLFYTLFWLWKGIEVDAFYRMQAHLFGDAPSIAIIAKKTIVDQFIYNPFWAGPTQVWFYLWKDSKFSVSELKRQLAHESFVQRTILVLVSSWVVWIPTVAIVYALPSALQIPLFNLVVCFWSLLLTSVSQRDSEIAKRR